MKFADLHLHTSSSDGTYLPSELVQKALGAGLSCIALTDHDTIEALDETIDIGRKSGLEVLPGIELSAEYDSQEVHILGYLVDYKNPRFLRQLEILKENRIERIHRIVDKLNKLGIDLKAKEVFDLAQGATPGRLHIARALVKSGFVKSIFEVFNKYIGDNGPAYSLGFRFSPQEAVKFIIDTGGIPVLAHPYILRNDSLITEFIKFGLMGIEVYYPEHSQGEVNFYLRLAEENKLLVTGGSDCHGKAKPEVRIGMIKIPYELVEKIKEAKEGLKSQG